MDIQKLRYYVSKVSIYVFTFCVLFLLQRCMILSIFEVKKYVLFNKVYLYEIVLAIISVIEVYKGIRISRPE